jgi:hypothetical protein
MTSSDLARKVSPNASMTQCLGVPIEKRQWLDASFRSGQHARFCCACPKCIPHVGGANHASETSNQCGALLQVICPLVLPPSLISHPRSCQLPCLLLFVFASLVQQSRFQSSRFADASCPMHVYLQSRFLSLHHALVLLPREPQSHHNPTTSYSH